MSDAVKATWQGGMHFISKSSEGEVRLDAATEFGGNEKGLRSKSLMLTSLAGCTGMDLGSLLRKMRLAVSNITIDVTGKLSDDHPKIYKETHIVYTFEGENLDEEKLKKAVSLSYNQYCGVIAMFRSFSEVTYEIIFKEVPVELIS